LLGEKNANLLGLIIIMKLQMAAMSRAESVDLSNFPPFYVYLDEFQNVVTESIAAILSEARKYKLSLNMTHQYMEQLPDFIKSAIFGNVGNMAFFRINLQTRLLLNLVLFHDLLKDVIKQRTLTVLLVCCRWKTGTGI
jgi:type IV secretory pathway TraG/TraD family ATPase VirD4